MTADDWKPTQRKRMPPRKKPCLECARLRVLVKDLADDLEAEIKGRNPAETLQYPSEQRRYERDMATVYKARRALEP